MIICVINKQNNDKSLKFIVAWISWKKQFFKDTLINPSMVQSFQFKKLWNTSIISKLFHWKLQEFIWSLDYFLYFWTIFLIYCLLFIKFLSHMNSVAKNFATNKIIMFTFSDNHKICMAAPSSKSSQYYWLGWFVGYKGKISPSRSVRHYLS